ncbi:hypothetical protein BH11VER1_BH11VER1_21780 [soil metagenome]
MVAFVLMQVGKVVGDDSPVRIAIGPKNDLSAINYPTPPGEGFGSAVCGVNLSLSYQEGNRIGAKNDHDEKRNILVIDDGKTLFSSHDKATTLPLVVLTGAKLTDELIDLVKGYNDAMKRAFFERKKATQPITPTRKQ